MAKKVLSVFLSVLMVMSLVMIPAMGVSANVAAVDDISDYTPNLNDDIITDYKPESQHNWTNNGGLTVARPDSSSPYYTITAGASQSSVPSGFNRPTFGVWQKAGVSGMVKDTPYVVKLAVKQNSKSTAGKDPNLVYGFVSDTEKDAEGLITWQSQWVYTQDITSTDYQEVGQLFTLGGNAHANVRFLVGLGVGNTFKDYKDKEEFEFRSGASVIVDWSKTYIAPERVYDVVNDIPISSVFPGSVANANAKVVNQLGITGNLNQSMEIYAVDADKNVVTGIVISDPDAEGNYTITVGDNVAEGDYTILARSGEYTDDGAYIQTPVTLTVEAADKYTTDYEAGDITTDLDLGLDASEGATGKNGITTVYDATTNYKYRITAATERDSAPYSASVPMNGIYWKHDTDNGKLIQGDSYVVKFNAKNVNEAETPYLVYGFVDLSEKWTYQYKWTEQLSSTEWQEFKQVFTMEHDSSTDNVSFRVGLGNGNTHTLYNGKTEFAYCPGASIDVDHRSYYIAPEAFHDIRVDADKTVTCPGGSIELDAAALNQIELEGTLAQDFSWAALTSTSDALAEGITITADETDSSKVKVTFGSDVEEGTYVIAAYSQDYDAARHIELTVSNVASIENVEVDTTAKTVTFDALNISEEGFTGAVYIAEYAPLTDVFVKAQRVPFTLEAGNTMGKEAEYTLEADASNEIRVYIWSDNLTPYIMPISKKNN